MKFCTLKQLALSFVLFSLTPGAVAQYVWLNERGIKQYSDTPPPASVPQNRILKEPGNPTRNIAVPASEEAISTDKSSGQKKEPMTLAEKNLEFQERRAEQAEKDKKAAEEAKLAADKKKNCDRARNYLRTLESGSRIARIDKNGERNFLSDEQRKSDIREANQILSQCN